MKDVDLTTTLNEAYEQMQQGGGKETCDELDGSPIKSAPISHCQGGGKKEMYSHYELDGSPSITHGPLPAIPSSLATPISGGIDEAKDLDQAVYETMQ